MNDADHFLHTTHRTVSWFNKTYTNGELELSAPYQRNPVWTPIQQAYLIDTILLGLPIPELYMQDVGNEHGEEKHIVVDGQQRIRAVLDFLGGTVPLDGEEVSRSWRGLKFDQLGAIEKKTIFNYKFVVRILPNMSEEEVRKIFARLNRNVVALNDQELRNATYWGPFIKSIQLMADQNEFWADAGIFSANDHRRMIDHEFISELAIAFLHGPQNKKDKLDDYYRIYEESYEDRERVESAFRKATDEIAQMLPRLKSTRWRKKSDFYTLFLEVAARADQLPWARDMRDNLAMRITDFGDRVTELLTLDEDTWKDVNDDTVNYARNVSRAASDRGSRVARTKALRNYAFPEAALPNEEETLRLL
ncbi:DUF262 domain-containing protein [Mesorhizobium sp. BR1-1-3]|uniref:DUF262 domain-containing protein n=1 Tax=Mesorhizobium sp. BR1-1-3 TaxID=2876651 RepID=UPI001CD07E5B|nr:DUF262 domain-containing protein [Mesorhizobium sp. BR1-1-3]MBZ9889860.1 DUF262 domain-containing protein [Mesorhizobium sp. BR1-1-3]